MKFVIVVLLLVVGVLFVPRYELMVLEDPFSEDYHVAESFLLDKEKCRQAAKSDTYLDLKPVCIRATSWGSMVGTSGKYHAERVLLTE